MTFIIDISKLERAGAVNRMDMVPQREAAVKTHKKKRSNTMAMKPQSLSSSKIHKQRFIKRKRHQRSLEEEKEQLFVS
jgi:hypothetical protein